MPIACIPYSFAPTRDAPLPQNGSGMMSLGDKHAVVLNPIRMVVEKILH